MSKTKSFASDNNAGVHPEILKAIANANQGYSLAYGEDPYSEAAVEKFKEHFGPDTAVFFVFIGTAANVLGLKTVTEPFQAIICPETAHINVDEGGAPEKNTGCKLLTVPTPDGKLRPEQLQSFLSFFGNQHHNQPKVISISQSTELGTVYKPEEVKALADFAHQNHMLLHMDGARIANAAANLNLSLRQITREVGVDILSFGGTKNGLMFGEAVLFFDPELATDFKYLRKQGMQLMSKMRFMAVQFETLLSNNLWLANAQNANRMAQLLAQELAQIPQIKITQKVEANGIFAVIPPQYIPAIQKEYYFYIWNEAASEVRLMTAYDTTEADIRDFIKVVKTVING